MSFGRARGPSRLGIRANLGQFSLLVGVNALVGGMIGQERTVLPLLGQQVFHLGAIIAALTFIVAFEGSSGSRSPRLLVCQLHAMAPFALVAWRYEPTLFAPQLV